MPVFKISLEALSYEPGPAPTPGAGCFWTDLVGCTTGCFEQEMQGAVVLRSISSPRLRTYQWSSFTGIGARIAELDMPEQVVAHAISNEGDLLAYTYFVGMDATLYLGLRVWDYVNGIGEAYGPVLTTISSDGFTASVVLFSPDGGVILMCGGGGLCAHTFSREAGIGAAKSIPADLAGVTVTGMAFSPSGAAVAVTTNAGSAHVCHVYHWNDATGFGARYADFTPTRVNGRGPVFAPDGTIISFGVNDAPEGALTMAAYRWSDASGFGEEIAVPMSDVPSLNQVMVITFTPDGDAVIAYGPTYLHAFKFSSETGFGDRFEVPPELQGESAYSANAFNFTGTAFIAGVVARPYRFSAEDGFGDPYPVPDAPNLYGISFISY